MSNLFLSSYKTRCIYCRFAFLFIGFVLIWDMISLLTFRDVLKVSTLSGNRSAADHNEKDPNFCCQINLKTMSYWKRFFPLYLRACVCVSAFWSCVVCEVILVRFWTCYLAVGFWLYVPPSPLIFGSFWSRWISVATCNLQKLNNQACSEFHLVFGSLPSCFSEILFIHIQNSSVLFELFITVSDMD
jgi:hypothetical protein